MLRRHSRGVAEHSQHILGKAMDQHYVDVPMSRIREIAMKLERGGVGFYPTAGTPFVHMDVGGVRHWPRMSYDQLARLFPDGKTVHIPSNGQPMPRYEEARAELEARGDSFSYPTATEVKSKGFFAWLFGGGEDEGDTAAARDEGSGRGQTRVASLDRNVTASAGPAMMYANHDKDAGVREFNLTGSTQQPSPAPAMSYAPSAPAAPPQRRVVAPPPVQQAAAEPPRQAVSDAQAEDVLARAMVDPQQKAVVPVAAPAPAAGRRHADVLQLHSFAGSAMALSAPMPPLRPVELASDGPRMPLPPGRPAEFMASNAAKSDRAPGVNAPKNDAIGALIAAAAPTRTANLPNAITQGFGAAKPAGPPQVLAFAAPGLSTPPARTYAPLPVARPSQFVAARLDRSNFRSLTGSGLAAHAIIHSGFGSAVTALRPAAQASLGTMVGQTSSLAKGFGADATDLPSDRFSGSALKSARARRDVASHRRLILPA